MLNVRSPGRYAGFVGGMLLVFSNAGTTSERPIRHSTLHAGKIPPIAAAQPDTQFDLICSGSSNEQHYHYDTTLSEFKKVAFSYRFRLNITTKKYCSGACTEIFDISEVNNDKIVLSRKQERTLKSELTVSTIINRIDASYKEHLKIDYFQDERATFEDTGTCQIAPFTPFPTTKF